MEALDTDYLIVGAGAVGLAFADTLLTESDADMIIVDRREGPGGHWKEAYPFVRLHQPSAFYGVASTELGAGRLDDRGWNAGLFELATGSEVTAYFEGVLNRRLLPSGRVRFLPMRDFRLDGEQPVLGRILGGSEQRVSVRKRIVDGTYYNTTIPSRHVRKFEVGGGALCIAPNELPRIGPDHGSFVILGAGKTAMDAAVWLIEMGVATDRIVWVRPRDSWLVDRETTQPTAQFFENSIGSMVRQMEACAVATSIDDLFMRLEAAGIMLRIDPTVRPTMFHYATISRGEVDALRTIRDVRRDGRALRLEPGRIKFEAGWRPVPEDAVFIDCTATAVERRPSRPFFDGRTITLQMARLPSPTFSAALAAYLEANMSDDAERNRLCTPCPLPDTPEDWPSATLANMMNQYAWNNDPALRKWITACRLDGFGAVVRDADRNDPAKMETLRKLKDAIMPAVANLQKLAAVNL